VRRKAAALEGDQGGGVVGAVEEEADMRPEE
jgi:hypothetical protein